MGWNVRDPASLAALWRRGPFDLAIVNGDARFSWLARAMGARRVVAFAGDRPAYKSWPATDLLPMPGEPMAWSDLVTTLVPGPPPPPYARGQWEAPDCRPYDRPGVATRCCTSGRARCTRRGSPNAGPASPPRSRRAASPPAGARARARNRWWPPFPAAAGQRTFAGRLDLPQLWDLVAHASLVVTGDTSVAHIGRAAFAPTVVIYGPSGPVLGGPGRFWANCPGASVAIDPFPCRDQDMLFKRRVAWVRRCARGIDECPAPRCMHEIGVAAVLAAAEPFLPRRDGSSRAAS